VTASASPLTNVKRVRDSAVQQRFAISHDYMQFVANRAKIMRELAEIFERQYSRTKLGFNPSSPVQYKPGYKTLDPQELLEYRQQMERLNLEHQQDEKMKEMLRLELSHQTQHAASAIALMDEIDSFIKTLCKRVDILTGDFEE
jgi:hypothetical protein